MITAHQLDPYKKIEAERWLLGELMDIKELSRLNLLYDLKHKEYAKTMLKLIIQYSKLKTVLFIDDFDQIITLMKPSKGTEEIFDPSYLYGSETQTPESRKAEKTLDKIIKLSRVKRLGIIITLNTLDSLEKIKKIMREKDQHIYEIFKDPLFLTRFEKEDIYDLYRQNFKQFLNSINYSKFLEVEDNEFFPLNKEHLDIIYNQSKGNPREIIKYLIRVFHEIIYSRENIKKTLKDFKSFF
ncbi:MAG: hypothetical protein GF383_04750 [Candidatus Lokiarchaeota archaeon]|nr:hypothetical protein [Candidatus Lokiarchaeota archaeon]MBD3339105.1 hypothetical protein [Candidatus Lokiarchaeota archaeon]